MIDSQVINRLLDAPLVIADMSLLNANAFYEMGIRHLKGLPTIHMYLEGSKIPFDVAPYRAIPFNYARPSDLDSAKANLKAVVDEVIKSDFVVDNPVTRARGFEQLEARATESQQLLLDELRQLKDRLHALERRADAGTSYARSRIADALMGSMGASDTGSSFGRFFDPPAQTNNTDPETRALVAALMAREKLRKGSEEK